MKLSSQLSLYFLEKQRQLCIVVTKCTSPSSFGLLQLCLEWLWSEKILQIKIANERIYAVKMITAAISRTLIQALVDNTSGPKENVSSYLQEAVVSLDILQWLITLPKLMTITLRTSTDVLWTSWDSQITRKYLGRLLGSIWFNLYDLSYIHSLNVL